LVKYELVCEYIHCAGKSVHVLGIAESEETARRWMEAHHAGGRPGDAPPDPACSCPVEFCVMRSQRPAFSYRVINETP